MGAKEGSKSEQKMEDAVTNALAVTLEGLDENILEYLSSVVLSQVEEEPEDEETLSAALEECVAPFLLSSDFTDDEDEAKIYCRRLAANLFASSALNDSNGGVSSREIRKLDVVHNIEEQARKDLDMDETNELMERMWGFDRIRKKTNAEMETQQSSQSQRQIRKQIKMDKMTDEKELMDAAADEEWEDARFLPDLSTDNGEKVSLI